MSTFKGKVTEVSPVEQVGNYEKQTVLIEQAGEYPESVAVEFFGKNQPKLAGIAVGDEVDVAFNYKARKGKNGGYFQGLSGWKIDKLSDF